uniref:RING-CH-type domain-containing protein n=1 Tax=Chenopodium quinoa TaxID=63459 RepID=A0A803M483_CHEQI
MEKSFSFDRMDANDGSFPRKLAQCRICHDEDESSNMEAPCACCGSLKYAHRRCVQMWCNQKGDTVCEICLQPYKPGYTAPPPRLPFAVIPVRLRIAGAKQLVVNLIFLLTSVGNLGNLQQFMILVVLRHTLPIVYSGAGEYSFTLYTLLMLRTIAILLPMFVMLKACSIIRHHRRHRQTPAAFSHASSDEENELAQPQISAHVIRIQ